MRRAFSLGGLAVAAAAGVAAAALIAPQAARAWGPGNLPPGWTSEQIHAIGASQCEWSYRIWTAGRAAWSNPFCTDSPSFQADYDAWVNAHYTAPPTSTSATTTTQATTTTTSTDTATTTNTTTTTDAAPDPAAPSSPVSTAPSDQTPTPPSPETTTAATTTTVVLTVTTTSTVTVQDPSLAARIAALEEEIKAITNRIDRLARASDAGWLAYLQAIAAGVKPAAAAEIARSTALNAIYGLGAFAP